MMAPSKVSSVPGKTMPLILASLTPTRSGSPTNPVTTLTSQPGICAMHSIRSTPGISGKPGKCPSNTGLSVGTLHSALIFRSSSFSSTKRSIIWKYSRRISPSSGVLGGDESVNACAKILEHEIFLGRGLALVHFLRPLLEGQLDAERLVDRKRDVEKVEAVDAEIVDGMTVRRDGIARNVAGFRDDIRD